MSSLVIFAGLLVCAWWAMWFTQRKREERQAREMFRIVRRDQLTRDTTGRGWE